MLKSIHYSVKPFIPRSVQIAVRRKVVSWKKGKVGNMWPIDPNSSKMPAGWKGWPNGKRFAVVLTHDVDTARGQEKCLSLLSMEEELGFRSSFNFVPENYVVDPELREEITRRGFEVGNAIYPQCAAILSAQQFSPSREAGRRVSYSHLEQKTHRQKPAHPGRQSG